MSRASYSGVAAIGAVLAIVFFSWLDAAVIRDAVLQAQGDDPAPANALIALARVGLAVCILGLSLAAWRSKSALVGALYAMVGVVLAFLPVIFLTLATGRNGAPAVLPEPMARLLTDLARGTIGPVNAVGLLGASMLVVGVALLVRAARDPSRSDPTAQEAAVSSDVALG